MDARTPEWLGAGPTRGCVGSGGSTGCEARPGAPNGPRCDSRRGRVRRARSTKTCRVLSSVAISPPSARTRAIAPSSAAAKKSGIEPLCAKRLSASPLSDERSPPPCSRLSSAGFPAPAASEWWGDGDISGMDWSSILHWIFLLEALAFSGTDRVRYSRSSPRDAILGPEREMRRNGQGNIAPRSIAINGRFHDSVREHEDTTGRAPTVVKPSIYRD